MNSQAQLPLVSVIIPCYNAERWLDEAIDSVLAQTYPHVEVIVVDDGSTDNSRGILQRYGQLLRVEYRPHLGGNAARNHGFAVSQGEYIQYVDADDYILPEKIEHQISFMLEHDVDVVYGDWRHQFHENDRIWLGPVVTSPDKDFTEYLLSSGGNTSYGVLLCRRKCIERCGGWDETLEMAQDTDFLIALALSGAKLEYQPGCYYIYRKYGPHSVSTVNPRRRHDWAVVVCKKWRDSLASSGRLNERYRQALATWQLHLARSYFAYDRSRYRHLIRDLQDFAPDFTPAHSPLYKVVWQIAGYEIADQVAAFLRPVRYLLSKHA